MVYLKQQFFVREERGMLFGKYQVPVSLAPLHPLRPKYRVYRCTLPAAALLERQPARPPAVRRGRHRARAHTGRPPGSPVGPLSSLRSKRAASDSLKFLVVSRPWCKGSFEQSCGRFRGTAIKERAEGLSTQQQKILFFLRSSVPFALALIVVTFLCY